MGLRNACFEAGLCSQPVVRVAVWNVAALKIKMIGVAADIVFAGWLAGDSG